MRFFSLLLIFATFQFGRCADAAQDPGLRGDLGTHDPSTIVKCNGRYYLFSSGQGISSKSSADGVVWVAGPRVFQSAPTWTTNAVPGFTGYFWAPDVLFLSNRYCLYYSISTWGSQVSAIGMASNPTLDPADSAYKWTDHGMVISSTIGSPYNTIDPSAVLDASGKPWLCFGSYWNGIYVTQLDSQTGMRIAPNSSTWQLAWNSSIEASCLYRRGPWYYLFVNYGSCCVGVNSEYNIRIGRSQSITGPYLDRNGRDMRLAGNSLFLDGTGRFAGPGHVGIFSENGIEKFSYHYYDAGDYSPGYGAYGTSKLDIRTLSWTADGWPVFTNEWSAVYDLEHDARDANGQYSGLVRGSASFEADNAYGRVLRLPGANAWVDLPAGVAYARTFEAVAKWNGGAPWQRIFDFGTDTSSYVMLTPSSGQGRLRCDIRANGATYVIEAPSALPAGTWTHVALTLDGSRGVILVNGIPVATNASVPLSPWQVRAQTNHLGRSKFGADPDFNGSFAHFAAHGRVLSAAELTRPRVVIALPSQNDVVLTGSRVYYEGSAVDFLQRPIPATNLVWSIDYIGEATTNAVALPRRGFASGYFTAYTNASGAYRVSLSAVDTVGRSNSTSIVLPAGTSSSHWSSFYPFTVDGRDASNRFNGLLVGGASIQSDPERGNVLNLSGSGQYLSLPAGATAARTISAWVKWRGGASWQRIFDFGRNTQHWFFLTPRNGSGVLECAITSESTSYVYVLRTSSAFPTNTWTHVAITLNGREAVLYLNGTPAAIHNGVNLLPADVLADKAYIGRSMFSADAHLNGQVDSLWLHSSEQTTASLFGPKAVVGQPSQNLLFRGSESIAFSGAAYDWRGQPLAPASHQWEIQLFRNGIPAADAQVLNGINSGVYEAPAATLATEEHTLSFKLRVTDGSGLAGESALNLAPALLPMRIDTVPSGLIVQIDGRTRTGPAELLAVEGFKLSLDAPTPQILGDTNYNFLFWSDALPRAHEPVVMQSSSNLWASYLHPSLRLEKNGPLLKLAWPIWARHFKVKTTTNLSPTSIWSDASATSVITSDEVQLEIPAALRESYFRLE